MPIVSGEIAYFLCDSIVAENDSELGERVLVEEFLDEGADLGMEHNQARGLEIASAVDSFRSVDDEKYVANYSFSNV